MKLYKGKVRLAGAVTNEVLMPQMSAPELHVLQRIHGKDSIADVIQIGETDRSDRAERNRLAAIYPNGPSIDGKSRLEGGSFVDSIFGVGAALPKEWEAPVPPEDETSVESEKETITLFEADPEAPKDEVIVRSVPRPLKDGVKPVVKKSTPKAEGASLTE